MERVKNYGDRELMAALQAPQVPDDAIKFLYRAHFEGLSVFVRQNSGTAEDAEDIFQEVLLSFIDLVRNGKFRQESTVKTFLYAMTRNIWFNEMKKRNRAEARELKYEKSKEDADPGIGQYISERESRKQMMEAVNRLGDTCKQILIAFYYENLSMKEILAKVNYENEQVIRNKKHKCLKQLAVLLDENPQIAQNLKTALQYDG